MIDANSGCEGGGARLMKVIFHAVFFSSPLSHALSRVFQTGAGYDKYSLAKAKKIHIRAVSKFFFIRFLLLLILIRYLEFLIRTIISFLSHSPTD